MKTSLLYSGLSEAILDNGMRVLVEEVPHSRSVSAGLWVRVGSRDDLPAHPGISHFVEHMLFKGTPTRNAREISRQIDALGGQINGATGKESTFYYAEAPASSLREVLEIISDIAQHPEFSGVELERERGVVLEEIRGRDDDPEQQAYELFTAGLWQNEHPLTRSVLGKRETIESVSRRDLISFHSRFYTPEAMILVVCGAADTTSVLNLASNLFEEGSPEAINSLRRAPILRSDKNTHTRDTGQTHIYIGLPAPDARSDDRFAVEVVNTILGGGMSSRLFVHVREERGLAYAVSSSVISYSDAGAWLTYAGIAPENVKQTLEILLEEIDTLHRAGVQQEELDLARAKLRGNFILDLESNINRMARLGGAAIVASDILSPDELIGRIDHVTLDDARCIIDTYVDLDQMNITVVGPDASGASKT
ncbi:MAG TPA: insulinase family protein [Candidatus Acetothermia bacterium]|nr:insulinase family protein [Candidatus Acetothermia bacterium]